MESVTAFERCTDDDSALAWRKKRRTILPRGEAKSDGQVNATGCVLSMPMQRMPVKIKTGNQCRVVPRKPLRRFWSLCETRNPGENWNRIRNEVMEKTVEDQGRKSAPRGSLKAATSLLVTRRDAEFRRGLDSHPVRGYGAIVQGNRRL